MTSSSLQSPALLISNSASNDAKNSQIVTSANWRPGHLLAYGQAGPEYYIVRVVVRAPQAKAKAVLQSRVVAQTTIGRDEATGFERMGRRICFRVSQDWPNSIACISESDRAVLWDLPNIGDDCGSLRYDRLAENDIFVCHMREPWHPKRVLSTRKRYCNT